MNRRAFLQSLIGLPGVSVLAAKVLAKPRPAPRAVSRQMDASQYISRFEHLYGIPMYDLSIPAPEKYRFAEPA